MIIESYGMENPIDDESNLNISKLMKVLPSNNSSDLCQDNIWNGTAAIDTCSIDYTIQPAMCINRIATLGGLRQKPTYYTIQIICVDNKYGYEIGSTNQALIRYCFSRLINNKDITNESLKIEFPELFV